MNDPSNAPLIGGSDEAMTPAAPAPATPAMTVPPWLGWTLAVLAVLCLASLAAAWQADRRGAQLERELVRRQQDSATIVGEARMLARQAQQSVGDTTAKLALLEARVAEVSVQRGQLEDLVQSLSRSRDENLLVDIEASIRVAIQQTAITGSAEPLVAALRQGDDRLARYDQPRVEGVRRAIARDLDRVKATSVADMASLGIKLDETIRLVDELTLLAVADTRSGKAAERMSAETGSTRPLVAASGAGTSAAASAARAASGASAPAGASVWSRLVGSTWSTFGEPIWNEARSLVRVTRIDHPEAMLLAPEQAFFVRENLKLRLLNARLALLSRQFDTAQADLKAAQSALERYFDTSSKRTALATELIRQVAGQARQVVVPRPDDTLAALASATGGR